MSRRALSAIQHHFHALIRRRAAEFGARATGQLPSIQTLTQGGPDEWFEVPEMHGGFAYRLTTRSGDWVLHVESWNRFVGGSEETHDITESGVVLIGRHNPADDYSFSSEMPAPKTATSSAAPRSVPAIPEYIRERICRLVPDGVPVVPGSTPVVAFGDARFARVATLGWNPSKLEFLDCKGSLLSGDEQRFETWETARAKFATDPEAVIFEGCNKYFKRNPYNWFDRLQRVLGFLGVSYNEGSACHLDLVQWPTDPVWSELPRESRKSLIAADLPFLRKQLAAEPLRVLLLNGTGIIKAVRENLAVEFQPVGEGPGGRMKRYQGRYDDRLTVIGWNLNLQSSFGVSNAEMDALGAALRCVR